MGDIVVKAKGISVSPIPGTLRSWFKNEVGGTPVDLHQFCLVKEPFEHADVCDENELRCIVNISDEDPITGPGLERP